MNVATRKAILLLMILFATWQVLYPLGLNTLVAYTTVLAVTAGFLVLDKQSLTLVGFRKPSGWRSYVGIGCTFAVAFDLYLFVLGSVLFSTAPSSITQPLIFSVGYGVLSVPYVLVLALVIGLVEETSFRGYILRNLRSSFPEGKANLYSSILFGLYHIPLFYIYFSTLPAGQTLTFWSSFVIYAFVTGLFLGYFYLNAERTILGPVSYHSSLIFIQSFVPYALAFSTAAGHVLITLPVIIFIPLLFFLKRTGLLGRPSSTEAAARS